MEKHFLDDFIRKLDKNAVKGSHKDDRRPWYNAHGDCIEFQTVQEAIVADRIDEFLTIYYSAISNKPIGFQVKDVRALVHKYGVHGMRVEAAVKDKMLVSLTTLLFSAFGSLPNTINRREGYVSAMDTLNARLEQVTVPI